MGKLFNYQEEKDFTTVDIELHEDSKEKDAETEALMRTVVNYFEKYAKSSNKITAETIESV